MDLQDDPKVMRLVDMFTAFLSTTALNGALHLPEKVLYPMSRWLLGGAIALSFAMLTNPQDFIKTYGITDTKFVMGLLLMSIVSGIVFSVSEYFHFAATTNSLAKVLSLQFAKELYGERLDEESKPTVEGIAKDNWKRFVTTIKMVLGNTKAFWLQILTLFFAISFLIKTFFSLTSSGC